MATFPGTSTAQAVGGDHWEEKQPRAIPESFFPPDQRTFQQDMEDGANTSGSQNAKKLGKRKISESNAKHGTCMYMSICFYCSAPNMECTEGKENSLSLLNYTCLKSWCILVATLKKLMPIKQKWFTKGSFTQKGFVLLPEDIILPLFHPSNCERWKIHTFIHGDFITQQGKHYNVIIIIIIMILLLLLLLLFSKIPM